MSTRRASLDLRARLLRPGSAGPPAPGRITAVAYDEFLQSDTEVAEAVSYPSLNGLLGGFDQVAVEASVDQASAAVGPASLDIHLGHSGDGHVWVRKEPAALASASTLSLFSKTYLDIGYDGGEKPSLGFVRLELTLRAARGPVRARVRVNVTANNLRDHAFSLAIKNAGGPTHDVYDRCYPGGSRIQMAKIRDLVIYWRYFRRLLIDFERGAAIVPRDQMVCFNAFGEYVLVDRGRVVFSSRGVVDFYIEQARRGGGPPRRAEDPQPSVTMRRDDDP